MSESNASTEPLSGGNSPESGSRWERLLQRKWLLGFVVLEVGLVVLGVGIDALAGPTNDANATLHVISGLAGIYAILVALIALVGFLAAMAFRAALSMVED